LQRSDRSSARAYCSADVVTLVRTHRSEAVVVLFNVSADTVAGSFPVTPVSPAGVDGGACWSKVLDSGAPEFGGSGQTLPPECAAGDTVGLGAWGFGVYQLDRVVERV
jgi:hypothetical protein